MAAQCLHTTSFLMLKIGYLFFFFLIEQQKKKKKLFAHSRCLAANWQRQLLSELHMLRLRYPVAKDFRSNEFNSRYVCFFCETQSLCKTVVVILLTSKFGVSLERGEEKERFRGVLRGSRDNWDLSKKNGETETSGREAQRELLSNTGHALFFFFLFPLTWQNQLTSKFDVVCCSLKREEREEKQTRNGGNGGLWQNANCSLLKRSCAQRSRTFFRLTKRPPIATCMTRICMTDVWQQLSRLWVRLLLQDSHHCTRLVTVYPNISLL